MPRRRGMKLTAALMDLLKGASYSARFLWHVKAWTQTAQRAHVVGEGILLCSAANNEKVQTNVLFIFIVLL